MIAFCSNHFLGKQKMKTLYGVR